MKFCAACCGAVILLPLVLSADDFKTIDGKELKGVTISRVEPDGIMVVTDSGIEKIPFTNLPADIQKKFKYDPAKAAKYQKAVYDAFIQRKKQEQEENYPTQKLFEAKVLIAAYDSNELSADQNFKGVSGIGIRGTISDIGRGVVGDLYVVLDEGVHCEFPQDAERQLTKLSKGQVVIICGRIVGRTLGSVYMDKCSLLK